MDTLNLNYDSILGFSCEFFAKHLSNFVETQIVTKQTSCDKAHIVAQHKLKVSIYDLKKNSNYPKQKLFQNSNCNKTEMFLN